MREEMPIGFGFALAENEKAMSSFAKMTEEEKKQVMEAARSVQTPESDIPYLLFL